MAKVVIIGAGGVGGVVTHKCAQLPGYSVRSCWHLAPSQVRCHAQLDRRLKPRRWMRITFLSWLHFSKRKAVHGHQCRLALPRPDHHGCVPEAGVHYMDTANYEPLDTAKFEYKWQWAYQEKFKKPAMALLGSGFDPGATNVFTAYLGKHYFDEMHTLDIIDVNGVIMVILCHQLQSKSIFVKSARNAATGKMVSSSPRLP